MTSFEIASYNKVRETNVNTFGKAPACRKKTTGEKLIQESILMPTGTSLSALLSSCSTSEKNFDNSPQEPATPIVSIPTLVFLLDRCYCDRIDTLSLSSKFSM